ncbi:MAG: hypothetical protein ABIF87_05535 [Pseudomonadota bacterium]|jgi:hypothetical protein
MENAKRLFSTLICRMSFIKTIALVTLIVLTIFMLVCKESNAVSQADYRAACKEIPVVELTNNPKAYVGQKVKVTGEVVVFEESGNQKSGVKNTILVIGVNDPSSALPSGKLPVFISYVGSTSAFINDKVTVYGEFYGNDTPKLKSIQEKTLPRINAKFIIIEPKK